MEEKQEVLVEEKPAEAAPAPVDEAELKKQSLMGFIFALVGLALCETVLGGIIFGALGLKKSKAAASLTCKPHAIFNKISKPVAIVAIILGALFVVFWIVYIILIALGVASAAIAEGMAR
jgi:uncharacterized membrane protein